MNIQKNVFGKSQDYNATMSRQEKCQRAEIQLKEVLDKNKSSLLQIGTLHQNTVRTRSIKNYCKNYFSDILQAQIVFIFKLPQVFKEYIPIILHCVQSIQIWIYFWSAFPSIWTKYEWYSVQIRENKDQNNSIFGYFSCGATLIC